MASAGPAGRYVRPAIPLFSVYGGFFELTEHLVSALDRGVQSLFGGLLAHQRLLDFFRPHVA
jgi:hypothetical protein